jgi:death on curing protein
MKALEMDDYLAIAAAVLDMDSATITTVTDLGLAESALHAPFASFGGQDFYPDPVQKVAVLCARLARNHPIRIDGNKRAAYLSMLVFMELNGLTWNPPSDRERALAVEAVAAGTMNEEDFIDWLREYLV